MVAAFGSTKTPGGGATFRLSFSKAEKSRLAQPPKKLDVRQTVITMKYQ
jgi:hypothetical protein